MRVSSATEGPSVTAYASPPLQPLPIRFDVSGPEPVVDPPGPVLTRRMSDLGGLFADQEEWRARRGGDEVVYTVHASPVPETARELPQSVTTILPGDVGGELFMTKGHQHPDPQGEIYLGLSGVGGLLLFDGREHRWLDLAEGVVGYIPPGWAHRSVNVGDQPYQFLAVYPGSAGHDYGWVLEHGMGVRAVRGHGAGEPYVLVDSGPPPGRG